MSNEELVLQYQQDHNSETINQLYQQNIGLIGSAAVALAAYEDPEDLKQEGFFGLVTAADLWRPDKGASFATYAAYWIRQAMTRYIDNCGSAVRIPVYRRERIQQYKKSVASFQAAIGRKPSSKELAALLSVKSDQVDEIRSDALAIAPKSMNEPLPGAEEITFGDTIADPRDDIEDLLDEIQSKELSTLLWKLVDDLGGRQAEILRKRYQDGLSLKSCGEALGLSIEGARQAEKAALRNMKRPSIKKQLAPFIDESTASLAYKSGLNSFRRTWTSAPERAVIRIEEILKQ